jgi:hypothetical protein
VQDDVGVVNRAISCRRSDQKRLADVIASRVRPLGFTPLPAGYLLFLVGVAGTYLALVECVKRWLLGRFLR